MLTLVRANINNDDNDDNDDNDNDTYSIQRHN